MSNPRIKIYNGAGTSGINAQIFKERFADFGFTSTFITAQEIKDPQNRWEDTTDILAVGGGSAGDFLEAVGEFDGAVRIKNFVEHHGGTYLGICSAAYLGAAMIKFDGHQVKKRRPGLGFFNGVARGGLDDLMGRPYTGNSDSAAIIKLLHHDCQTTYPTLYWGGPKFLLPSANKNITPLAWYSHEKVKEPYLMALRADVGTRGGRAFLIGHHIETSHHNIAKYVKNSLVTGGAGQQALHCLKNYAPHQFDNSFALLLQDMGLTCPQPKQQPNILLKQPA